MISNRIGKRFLPVFAAGLFFILPAYGQASPRANTVKAAYDLTKEVKIEGVIQKIDATGPTVPVGTHIQIQTPQGLVDAHLGFGAAAKPARLGISEGQNVTIIGMMETVGESQVLFARLLTTPNQIFVLRNEHGIPVRGVLSGAPNSARMQKGGL